ncbi:MAG: hypothetical protein JWM11_6669 [Planctomycetaceae bacterium]|nr:hypothetical protein [Planctomycetaceae bacterium]
MIVRRWIESVTFRQSAIFVIASLGILCWMLWRPYQAPKSNVYEHGHDPGFNGGIIIAVGQDHYHVEALFAAGGMFKLFTLGKDQTQVLPVPIQEITAYVRSISYQEAVPVVLKPKPHSGDPAGQVSEFEGEIPLELVGSQLVVIVPNISIADKRFRFSFMTQAGDEKAMPAKVTNEAEQTLYLTSGGSYTSADVLANGSTTASKKYKGFRSSHDMHPKTGDIICPVTHTKANANCTWIIDGQKYSFCCPPCIDEFVKLAKENSGPIQAPSSYVKR